MDEHILSHRLDSTDRHLAELAGVVAQLRDVARRHNDAIRLLEVGLQRAAATLEEVTR
jgi:hypothetical protein